MYHVKKHVGDFKCESVVEPVKDIESLRAEIAMIPAMSYATVKSGRYRVYDGRKRLNLTTIQKLMGWERP